MALLIGSHSVTALVVEDNDLVRDVLRDQLEDCGILHVIEASNGEEAITKFADAPTPIDLAICDFMMPGISGIEVGRRLRHSRPDLPLLFISGFDASAQADMEGDGKTSFLQKPFTLVDLRRAVSALLSLA